MIAAMSTARLTDIYRYPVKGLTPERREEATLETGGTIPGDRRFALARASTPTSGSESDWLPKTSFLVLLREEKLAQLETVFDDATGMLEIRRHGRRVAGGNITTGIGRTMVEDFFDGFMREEARGRPKLVEAAAGQVLSDKKEPLVSIINRASVHDLERVMRHEVDPLRFRGNLLIDDLPAWAEFGWVGRTVRLGEAELEVVERIGRCAATDVNPATAERDTNIPKSLQHGFGHADMGVYARVSSGGRIAVGDTLVAGEAGAEA